MAAKDTYVAALVAVGLLMQAAACVPYSNWSPRHSLRNHPTHASTIPNVPAESPQGRPLLHRTVGNGSRSVLLLGAIHGDEPGSHLLVRDFETWFRGHASEFPAVRLIVATPVNPDGLAAGTRRNAHGVDLNRNFPATNFRPSRSRGSRPLSEPESRFVARLLRRFKPTLVISVHQPRRSVNWDGPAKRLAHAMARLNGYRAEATVGYATPGSLGSWLGVDRGIPIITLELPRHPGAGHTFLTENLAALRSALEMVASERLDPRTARSFGRIYTLHPPVAGTAIRSGSEICHDSHVDTSDTHEDDDESRSGSPGLLSTGGP